MEKCEPAPQRSVSAQISVYPIRQPHLTPAIRAVAQALERQDLVPEVGPMSTFVVGDADRIFAALREGFERAGAMGPTALVVTISNACPPPDPVDS